MSDDLWSPLPQAVKAKRYDGSNAAEFAAFVSTPVTETTVYEPDGTVTRTLSFPSIHGGIPALPPDYYAVERPNGWVKMHADEFERQYERITRDG